MSYRFLMFVVTLTPFVAFTVLYWLSFPTWWRSRAGRMLMALAVSLSSVLAWGVVNQFPDISDVIREVIRAFTLGGVFLAGCLLVATLLLERRDARRNPDCPKRRKDDH